jgi:hypothetical protein
MTLRETSNDAAPTARFIAASNLQLNFASTKKPKVQPNKTSSKRRIRWLSSLLKNSDFEWRSVFNAGVKPFLSATA